MNTARLQDATSKVSFLYGEIAYNENLVRVVEQLAEHPDVRSTLVAVGVPEQQHPAYAAALEGLADADMIRPRAEALPESVEETA